MASWPASTESSAADAALLFDRHPANPLLVPQRWPYPANAVMNAGAAVNGAGTVLVCRVEDRRGFSHLTAARSADGVTGWSVDDQPILMPDPQQRQEAWGLEDPRLTRVDEMGGWIMAYTAFGPGGPGVSLALSEDLRTFRRLGLVMVPENKNAAFLPRRVDGQYILFHRPHSAISGGGDIWLSRSRDLKSWTAPEAVLARREGAWWDAARIGMGPPPLETDEGWLVVYHGVRRTVAGELYRVGLALLDLDEPTRVLRRSPDWLLSPEADYERVGDVPGVVFPCGLVHDPATGELRLYYGAADTCVALAVGQLSVVLDYLRNCPEC